MKRENPERLRQAGKVSAINIILNALLCACKLVTGLLARSSALTSDAVDSASDVLSTLVVMAGVRLAERESDTNHPYGHERIECIASLALAVMLLITGAGIGYSAAVNVFTRAEIAPPSVFAPIVAGLSLMVKGFMWLRTRRAAEQLNSSALKADAINYRSDALASVGILAGLIGSRWGLPILDPLAGLAVCAFILKAAVSIAIDAFRRMLDTACDEQTENLMRETALSQKEVSRIDRLSTRLFGNRIYVEIEIALNGDMKLNESHAVAQSVHDLIEERFPSVKHCMVHVNPEEEAV